MVEMDADGSHHLEEALKLKMWPESGRHASPDRSTLKAV
jgi:hypothetical protein